MTDIIFDSTLSNVAVSKANIEKALATGRTVAIRYVWRDPIHALVDGALPRAMDEGQGRTVTLRGLEQTRVGSRETVLRLAAAYAADPRVRVYVRENAEDAGLAVRTLAWLAAQPYDDQSVVEARLLAALEQARASGAISDAVYAGTLGVLRRQ